jgi:hypothetical protein
VDRGRVKAVSEEVATGLDVAQELYRNRQARLCLVYLETVISPSPAHWYAACALLCQGIASETPACDCTAHGQEQCYQVGVYDPHSGARISDPMYDLSTDVITAYARDDWDAFAYLLGRAQQERNGGSLLAILFARLCQLIEANEGRH